MASIWHTLAGIAGASGVALGAYGAHGFRPADDYYNTVFERANKYHFLGSMLLAIAPITKRTSFVGGLAATGTLLFSGSCYAVAFKEDRSIGKMAPYG